ncbi:hypothetical protein QM583_02265 [Gordonia alkanivorans]|uniref:hypothetical protein n=1 Tax=Gordonia alkanivorans TaxID=84096 RepID=UPI0024B684F3|nr:hypothetical protein [Gordonia alkanivorans]MDJ0025914.1 hypothetical protein [Gordonia alkanivorans]
MENGDWDALRENALCLVGEVLGAAGCAGSASVEWFQIGSEYEAAGLYRIDQSTRTIGLNRDVVMEWHRGLSWEDAEERFAALALRAAAALQFGPPAFEWREAAELHVRSEQEQGLDEDYARAFAAAHQILENHRLDQRVRDLVPGAGTRLAELVQIDLESHPTFDLYPRAAIVIGRPDLPNELSQPAIDEFVDRFGVDEAHQLASILAEYVALEPDAVDEMVDITARLVFQAFPEAMGLTMADADVESDDLWPLQGTLSEGGGIDWNDFEMFVVLSLARFSGEAGLDYGDALLIGLDGNPLVGRRIGAWARSGEIDLDFTQTGFDDDAVRKLLARGWEQFENAPESFHKTVTVGDAAEVAAEFNWLLRDLVGLPSTSGLELWGRGSASAAAATFGWTSDTDDPAPAPASPVEQRDGPDGDPPERAPRGRELP